MASLKRVKIAPKGMGLNDFVAEQEGFFAAEGLDVEFDWKTFRGTQSSWKNLDYFQRPQDRPYTEDKQEVIQGACVWGTICNASAGMGRVVPDVCEVHSWAIFASGSTPFAGPEDPGKDVLDLGRLRAGSHFNVPYRLEKYLPLDNIKTVNTGGFGARLKALLEGEVEAASLLPPQIAMAEQLGLRKIIEDRFKTLWWVPEGAATESHARARSCRRKPWTRTSRNIFRFGKWPCRPISRLITPGISPSSAVASASSIGRCRGRNSPRPSRRSSGGGWTST